MAVQRKIVKIDEEKCDGCGLCARACAEGAIQIVDGKARLTSDSYCDGLGACLGECPRGAITIEERTAEPFDEEAVQRHLARTATEHRAGASCPSAALRTFTDRAAGGRPSVAEEQASRLGHWPVQLMLVPPEAPFLQGADLVVCADCVPFAVPDLHARYLEGRAVLVGCPKLDDIEYYREKLADVFAKAKPARVTVLRMQVPCCGALARAVVAARDQAAPHLPIEVHTIGIRGGIQRELVQGQPVDGVHASGRSTGGPVS